MDNIIGADLLIQKERIGAIQTLRELHEDFEQQRRQIEAAMRADGYTDKIAADLSEQNQYQAALVWGIEALEREARSEQRPVKKVAVIIDTNKGAIRPTRAHRNDAGLDLYSTWFGVIKPGHSVTIDTGVHVQIPVGYVGMVKSKSGLNVHMGIQSEGVIDAGYTGSIMVKLYNHGESAVEIKLHDKISQLVLMPIITPEVELVDYFPKTDRGANGIGSTGR